MQADKTLSYGLFIFLGLAVTAYAVRIAFLGRARSLRLDKDGGSAFLSVPVMELGYWVLRPIVNLLQRVGATANGVTIFGVVPGIAAGFAAAKGWFALACLLGMTCALGDALDGMLAKRLGGSTAGGQALDSILDRVTESALFMGIALYFHASVELTTLCLLGLFGAYLTSYVSAKADAMGVKLPRGVMRRPERAVYVLTASAFTPIWGNWVAADSPAAIRFLPVLAVVTLVGAISTLSALLRLRALLAILAARPVLTTGNGHAHRGGTQELSPLEAPASEEILAAANRRGVA